MKDLTLVVMAAGMGSRFGGLKQMEPIGPNGEALLNFSVYDAKKAGFNKVVFIIKESIEKDFKEMVGNKIAQTIDVEYVFQTTDNLPEGRVKPWGTAHAVLCCKDTVKGNFAILNADDYYGSNAFDELARFMQTSKDMEFAMVCYDLKNTLSDNGTVARGVCVIEDGYMKDIDERTDIADFKCTGDNGEQITLPEDAKVSMNLWALTPEIFPILEAEYEEFLKGDNLLKAEFLIPRVIGKLVKSGKATVKAIPNKDRWYGITYKEDKEAVQAAMKKFVEDGLYDGI
ncbi:MAG: nucleotidyltransferase [Ruminococcaceae bacterium]|nr:nucleotidyltransferase [Oscillospiraceae bacterium]